MNRLVYIFFLLPLILSAFLDPFTRESISQTGSIEEEVAILLSEKEINEKEVFTPPVLADPPEIIKGAYFTSWSASSEKRMDYALQLASTTEINAVIIDIKDYSGQVFYDTAVPEAEKYKAETRRIADIDSLIEKFHQQGVYVIARITVFQDPILAEARPELAIKATSSVWLDSKGLAWIDVSAREAWDYNIAIAKDAARHGFDEINFDYVRFPSDGSLKEMVFPFWKEETPKNVALREFFAYLRQEMEGTKISVDLFGLVTVRPDDMGIGQILEDTFPYFDYICPMVYPSHYADWFLGYAEPAEHPYEIVKHSMEKAMERWASSTTAHKGILRPWLQDFDMGADYDAAMIKNEIRAVEETMGEDYKGFMLWSPSNTYTSGAIGR